MIDIANANADNDGTPTVYEAHARDRAGKPKAELRARAVVSIVDAGRAGKLDHADDGTLLDANAMSDLAYRWLVDDREVDDAQDAAVTILEAEGKTWKDWVSR